MLGFSLHKSQSSSWRRGKFVCPSFVIDSIELVNKASCLTRHHKALADASGSQKKARVRSASADRNRHASKLPEDQDRLDDSTCIGSVLIVAAQPHAIAKERADNNVPITKNEHFTTSSAELGRERFSSSRTPILQDVNNWFAFSIGCFEAQAQSTTADDDAKS